MAAANGMLVSFLPLLMLLFGRKPSDRRQTIVKSIQKMSQQLRKGKTVEAPQVMSRREMIKFLFSSKMTEAGLQTTEGAADAVPLSFTHFAQYMRSMGVDEGLVEAMQSGIVEAESEAEVDDLIDAAIGTPDIQLTTEQAEPVKDLARQEWRRSRRAASVG